MLTDTERDVILSELCGGMSQLLDMDSREIHDFTIPPTLRLGLSRLAAAMIKASSEPIQSVPDAVSMMQRPLGEWEVTFPVPEYLADLMLMDGEFLTEDADALIVSNSDVAAELTQGIMRRLIEMCRASGKQDDYVAFRRFVIEHPVASRMEMIDILHKLSDDSLRSLLRDEAFESVPGDLESDGQVLICQRCGWTLVKNTYRGSLGCADAGCRRLEGMIPAHYSRGLSAGDGLRRVRAGLARYTARPGRLELSLFETLSELDGLKVELWPGFDSYDLGVTFPTGEVWAIDCKDSSRPSLLAARLNKDTIPRQPSWRKAFYVFPAYRKEAAPNYERVFRTQWKSRQEGVNAVFDEEFLRIVEKHLQAGKESA